MIIYSRKKDEFCDDVFENRIEDEIYNIYQAKIGGTSRQEIRSWKNSMQYMKNIVESPSIPNDAIISIEFMIPNTAKRVDFIISGQDTNKRDSIVIVELKQWEKANKTGMDAIVSSFVGKSIRDLSHPSYQAWTYASLLESFNETVQEQKVGIYPCAYLHNGVEVEELFDDVYKDHLEKAPLYKKDDARKLREFIENYIKYGDSNNIIYEIENGRIRPSKSLADELEAMLMGNESFLMIDDQKVVYEKAMYLARQSNENNKNVFIVEGGPGSGKSVVAINLLVNQTSLKRNARYVTKNSAPREVYEKVLTGSFKKSHISNMFVGSGTFMNSPSNMFDYLIVDEAHRLNEKSGLFSKGENQVKEIIVSSLCSVFFLDENQKVHWKDIGSKEEIEKWATSIGAKVHYGKLESQFRCNGSDGYMAWLDNVLQIKHTANFNLEDINYDFRVFDDVVELRKAIIEKNKVRNKARLVAGYCWDWVSKKDSSLYDIEIGDSFKMKWNLVDDGQSWIIREKSVEQIGCIHTCQGLELDYVGVIVGNDLSIENNEVKTNPHARAKTDKSLSGFKKDLNLDKVSALEKADEIIRNTYRTLMTRGQKGCYIYSENKEIRDYFKKRLTL